MNEEITCPRCNGGNCEVCGEYEGYIWLQCKDCIRIFSVKIEYKE